MPSPKELAKALAYQGEIRNTSRNRLLGGVADALAPVSEFLDRDKLPESIPFLGGMSLADLGLKGAQSLVNDMSYGTPPIRGASLQTAKVDPRVLDLAGVSGAMMPVAKNLGKAALREGARQIETGTGIGRAALDPRMMAVHAGGMFPGKKMPSVDTLAKVKDKFIYHSGVADDIDNMKYGIEPTNQGGWVREVASGAVDDVDNLLEQSTPLSWFSDEPNWVAAKVARKLGKNFADVTDEDIIKHGHVAMIPRKGDHASDIYKVGEEGLSNGEYSRVTNLRGEEMPAHQTDLYQENNYGQRIEPFGVERNEYITAKPVEPMFQLNGQELLDFMRKSGTRSNPSSVGGAMMHRPKTEFEIRHDTAQRNAALPVEQGGLGLPAGNMPLDRAKAMGFDTPAYHGTNADIKEFDLSKHGTSTDKGDFGKAVYVSTDNSIANSYANAKDIYGKDISGANVMPLSIKENNVYPVNGQQGMTELINKLGGEDAWYELQQNPDKYANAIKDLGYDSVRDYGYKQSAVFEPKNIRSRFAAFDPMRRHEADILAGVGVGGMLDPQAIAEALRQQDRK
jgi:hypothetical protein